MSIPEQVHDEVRRLLWTVREGDLKPDEAARLQALLADDSEVRELYVVYSYLCGSLEWDHSARRNEVRAHGAGGRGHDSGAGVQGSDADLHSSSFILHPSLHCLLGGVPLAYLTAALLAGAGILAAWAWNPPGERGVASLARGIAQPAGGSVVKSPVVGKITKLVGGDWRGQMAVGAEVHSDQQFLVSGGLLEISYNSGARVILEGPAAFGVDSANSGLLQLGKATVCTPKVTDRPLFCVRSQTAVVTGRGDCQFGLDVDRSGASHVCVFRGRVEFHPPERWTQPQILLLETRDWLLAERNVDGALRIDFIKGRKLPEEFVNQWFKGIAIAFGETKGDTAPQKRIPNS